MSHDVLFIHSAGAQSDGQGSSALVSHLRQHLAPAYSVMCPAMPDPDKPSYGRWKHELDRILAGRPSTPILVGHSLGGSVLLKYLSEQVAEIRVAGLFVVAAPWWGAGGWDADEFILKPDFARTLPTGLRIHLYQGRNDDVVDASHVLRYAEALPQATVRWLDGGGHTFDDGLPVLADDIRALADPARPGRSTP